MLACDMCYDKGICHLALCLTFARCPQAYLSCYSGNFKPARDKSMIRVEPRQGINKNILWHSRQISHHTCMPAGSLCRIPASVLMSCEVFHASGRGAMRRPS